MYLLNVSLSRFSMRFARSMAGSNTASWITMKACRDDCGSRDGPASSGLWRRCIVPLFRIHAEDVAQDGARRRVQETVSARGNGNFLEYRFDLNGRLIDVPSGTETLTGRGRESMVGSLFSRFLGGGGGGKMDSSMSCGAKMSTTCASGCKAATEPRYQQLMDLFPVITSGEISAVRGTLRPLVERPLGS